MLRNAFLIPVVALLALPALACAQFEAGNWSLEVSGQGNNDKDFNNGSVAAQGNIGYFLSKEFEVGVRQTISYVGTPGGHAWDGATAGAADFHFDLDRWQPYVGANVGYLYGESTSDHWIAGPEVGVKYFVNSTTFVDVLASYEFDLNNGIDSGSFLYSLGLGFRW
jgi:hypothetical protein